jgi:multidrug resistance efflux pump
MRVDDPSRTPILPPPSGDPPLGERVRSLRLPKEPTPRGGTGRLAWTLCLVFATTTAVLGYRLLAGQTREEAAAPTSTAAGETVPEPTAAASAAPGEIVLESKGYIIPTKQILVSPKVSGMVVRLPILEGKQVKKGDILAELEDTDYRAEVARAEAALEAARQRYQELQHYRPEEVEQARKELAEAKLQAGQLQVAWERKKDLLRSSAISQEEYDVAESEAQAAQRRVERLELAVALMEQGPRREKVEAAAAEVRQAEAELVKARWRLDNCTIRAPVDGTILKKNAEEGNIVNPIAFNGSFSLCEMADLSHLEVELSIQERDIAKVFPGQKCTVRAEAFPDRLYEASVSRLMPIADRAKGAVPVRVEVVVPQEEEGVYLKPEMGAIVSFYQAKR